MAILRRHYR